MTSPQFLELVFSLSVQVAFVVIATQWLGRLLNNERSQCRLWTVCYVVLLALVVVALLLPHPRLFKPWASVGTKNTATFVTVEMQVGRLLFYVWLAGAAVSLLLFALRSFQANRFLKTCRPVDPSQFSFGDAVGNLPEVSDGLSRRKVRLLSSATLSTPFCWQFHHPYIVVPEFLLGFDQQEIGFIIRHELEHLKTGHPLQLFLQRIVEVVFWFHPMVWWASQQSALSREFACDEASIDSSQDIATYLRTLLTIVEYGASQPEKSPTTLAFGRGKSIVAKRARRLVQIARSSPSSGGSLISAPSASFGLVVVTVLIAFVWLPIDVLASPRANWSPWPIWSANVLHDFGISARDFEVYDHRFEIHELLEHESPENSNEDKHGHYRE